MVDAAFGATTGETINPAKLNGRTVLYIYPMTGRPDTPLPDGWDDIPGARGCTPQSCGFRDQHSDFLEANIHVLGLSTQSTQYQLEAQQRLHLAFPLLSDESRLLKHQLSLPTFTADGLELYRRVTLVINSGVIEKVFYPVFPPGDNARDVVDWLTRNT